MSNIAYDWAFVENFSRDYRQSLKVGDSLLVLYDDYHAAYAEVEAKRQRNLRIGFAKQRAKNRPVGILAEDTLVNMDGETISANAGSFGGFVVDSQTLPLQEGEDVRVRLSPESTKALDEQFGNELAAQQDANSPQISEEKWKMQEALRMLEEAAR